VSFEVIGPGSSDLTLSRSQSDYLETTVFELDGDQGPYSRFDTTSLSFSSPRPDIAVKSFQVNSTNLRQGIADITYEVANYGHVDSLPFWIELHHTSNQDTPLTQNSVVWNQYVAADAITGLSSTGQTNQLVELDRASLYQAALSEDPTYPISFGTPSAHQDWLHLLIKPDQSGSDALASNNRLSTPVQYFPWDLDGNGRVTTSDAIEMLNHLGPATLDAGRPAIHDLNGDGFVTQTEAMEVVNRIGLTQSQLTA